MMPTYGLCFLITFTHSILKHVNLFVDILYIYIGVDTRASGNNHFVALSIDLNI